MERSKGTRSLEVEQDVPALTGSFSSTSSSADSDCTSSHFLTIPGTMGFTSAHTLINKERVRRGYTSLRRSILLDELCRQHSALMAEQTELLHCTESMADLKEIVDSQNAGENIQRGPSVKEMHKEAMRAGRTACKNILGSKFVEFGVGTAVGSDGRLYMTQLFRGPPESDPSVRYNESHICAEQDSSVVR